MGLATDPTFLLAANALGLSFAILALGASIDTTKQLALLSKAQKDKLNKAMKTSTEMLEALLWMGLLFLASASLIFCQLFWDINESLLSAASGILTIAFGILGISYLRFMYKRFISDQIIAGISEHLPPRTGDDANDPE